MDFWRSEAYSTFFDYLDNTGGFYYERWGDAPVHSIGAALLANKSQVHFFRDIGYRHPPFQRCPQGALHSKGKCWCDPGDSFGESFFRLSSFVQTHFDVNPTITLISTPSKTYVNAKRYTNLPSSLSFSSLHVLLAPHTTYIPTRQTITLVSIDHRLPAKFMYPTMGNNYRRLLIRHPYARSKKTLIGTVIS